jgi:hypothetical protein
VATTTAKTELLRSRNDLVALFAADSGPSDGDSWSFECECGAAGCREWVDLELAEYGKIRTDRDSAILAAGHAASSRTRRVRREAELSVDSSRALRAQAEHQQKRAQRLLDDARNVVARSRAREAEARPRLNRMLDLLEHDRDALTGLADDDRILGVLIKLDELVLVIAQALAAFESKRGSS